MKTVSQATRHAAKAALIVALMVLTGCSLQPNDHTLPGQTAVGSDGYTVTVLFNNVENLVPNSNVQFDDVTVGTVASIKISDWKAKVELRLLKEKKIPADAVFSIGQKTLLGAQYVEIDSPAKKSSPAALALADGDTVGSEQTGSYPQTEQVLGAASLLLNNGGLSQISTITGQLSQALDSRVPNTRDLITKLNELLGVLDDNKSDIVATLQEVRTLSGHLADQSSTISRALKDIGPGLEALNRNRQALITAVLQTGRFSTRAAEVVATSETTLLNNLDAIRPVLTRLSTVSSQLPEALKFAITVPFPIMTSSNAIQGDYANLFTTLDLSLPALARNFGGAGVPTSLQATDPITGPLEVAGKTNTSNSTADGSGSSSGNGSTPAPQTPTPSPSAGPTPATPAKPCNLVTALLGGC